MNLDNVFEKAKDVFETAYRKTENAVNAGKQKLDIAALENKLNKSYEILGKVCYDEISHGGSFDADASKPILDDIEEKRKQIEELKKEVAKTRNKKVCPSCNKPIEKNASYCNSCGAKV